MRVIKSDCSEANRRVSPQERSEFRLRYGYRKIFDAPQAHNLFNDTHGKYWLECDCHPIGDRQTIIVPRAPDEVQRHPDGPEHASTCPFYRPPAQMPDHRRSHEKPDRGTNFTFLWDQGEDAPDGPREDILSSEASRGKAGRRPKLARLLFVLLHEAGFDRLSLDEIDQKAWHSRLRLLSAAKSYQICPGVPVSSVLCIAPNELDVARTALSMPKWPKGVAAQGILICVAQAIQPTDHERSIRLDFKFGRPLEIQCPIPTFGESGTWSQPPYLFIGVFSDARSATGFPIFHRAYAYPALNGGWMMPVDSAYERLSFQHIVQASRDLHRSGHVTGVTVEKPLFDLDVRSDGEMLACRPDFLLHVEHSSRASACVVVETMGSDDAEYRERKSVTHPRMAHLGPIVEHEVHRLSDDKQMNRDLHSRFRRKLYAVTRDELAQVARRGRGA